METLKEWAIFYASKGWRVFPCGQDKKPLVQGGCLSATADYEIVRRWWTVFPDANIGIATGDGLAVVDIDQAETPEGVEIIPTATVKTSRGHHYYYSAHQEVKGGANIHMPHVDLRGEGGYVIAPPSVHESGHVYTWEGDIPDLTELPVAPDWVLSRTHGGRRVDQHAVTEDEEREHAWRPAREGERDARAVSFAARLVKGGLIIQRDLANSILSWNEQNEPPMGTLVGDPEPKEWANAKAKQALMLAAGNGGRKIEPTSVGKLRTMNVERSWIVEGGVLTEHSKTIIYGETGTGKTFLGLQLAHSIASGTPFLDKFNVPVAKRVLYLSGENAIDDLKVRVLNFDKEFHYSDEVLLYDTFDLDLAQAENMNVLRECVKEYNIDVVIIDPLYVFARVDEAKLLDVIGIEIALNRLIVDLDVSVVLLHHPTKSSFNSRGAQYDRGINELRGAGWAMWAECVIKMSGTADDDRTLVFQKVRSGVTGQVVPLKWSENQVFSANVLKGDSFILEWIKVSSEDDVVYMRDLRTAIANDKIEGCEDLGRRLERLHKAGKIKWPNNKAKLQLK